MGLDGVAKNPGIGVIGYRCNVYMCGQLFETSMTLIKNWHNVFESRKFFGGKQMLSYEQLLEIIYFLNMRMISNIVRVLVDDCV